jgi:hypothetical protein
MYPITHSLPLLVIVVARRLKGLEGPVGRVDPAEDVGEELSCEIEKDHDDEERASAKSQICLGHSRCCLELDKLWNLAELLIQLSIVETSYG